MSSLYPEMRFSWEIKSVDALFCNGLTRLSDLSKEAILQAIKDSDLRFLQVKGLLVKILCDVGIYIMHELWRRQSFIETPLKKMNAIKCFT